MQRVPEARRSRKYGVTANRYSVFRGWGGGDYNFLEIDSGDGIKFCKYNKTKELYTL